MRSILHCYYPQVRVDLEWLYLLEQFNHLSEGKQMTDVKLLALYSNTWDHLTVLERI